MGRIKKQVESSLTVDMQFVIDFPLLAAKNKIVKQELKSKNCPILDFFERDKPKGYNKNIDINTLAITYLQLHNVDKNSNVVEMYNSINKGHCIPLKTYH